MSAKVVVKTADGKYVGGAGGNTELVKELSRAYVYEDGATVDAQISIVNTLYGWNWKKCDLETEFDRTVVP